MYSNLKDNEIIIEKSGIQIKCVVKSILYDDENNKGYIVYMEQESNKALSICEIIKEGDDIIFEEVVDNDVISNIIKNYKKMIDNFD